METIKINVSHSLINEENVEFFKLGSEMAMKIHEELEDLNNCPESKIVMLGISHFACLATFIKLEDVKVLYDLKANMVEMIEQLFETKIQHEIEKLEKGIKNIKDDISHTKVDYNVKKKKKTTQQKTEEKRHELCMKKIKYLNDLIIHTLTTGEFSMPEITSCMSSLSVYLLCHTLKAFNNINAVKEHSKNIMTLLQADVEQRIEILEKEMKEGEKSNGK